MKLKTAIVVTQLFMLPMAGWSQETNDKNTPAEILYAGYLSSAGGENSKLADVHYGRILSRDDSCTISCELNGIGIFNAKGTYSESGNLGIGITPYFRYVPITVQSIAVFVEAGIGAIYYFKEYPEHGSCFNFSRQFGVGFTKKMETNTLFGCARWFHTSNQNIYGEDRNPGLNALGLFIGLEM